MNYQSKYFEFMFFRKKNSEISIKELREQFHRMRDFEISNLWQRSVFISALIIVFLSGYGLAASSFLKEENFNKIHLHEVCAYIALLGLVFSIIWIMMAKGSKAWYEVYEKKIIDLEENFNREFKLTSSTAMGECDVWHLDSSLFSNKAGRYSVSKLNIVIGRFLMFNWFCIFLVHVIFIFNLIEVSQNITLHAIIVTVLVAGFLVLALSAYWNKWAESSSLCIDSKS